ncbi:NAD(P)/FAD-dependent oxidoreductase [Mesorhizobium atlanticum]
MLVIDAGQPRNRFAEHSHGFFRGTDGRRRTYWARPGAQLLAYPAVTMIEGRAKRAAIAGTGFEVEMDDGEGFGATRLVLATGVQDVLPDVPGLAAQWGKTVLHCPYCHGYEVAGGLLGVLATGPMSLHQAELISDWGDVTLFADGLFEPDADQARALEKRNIRFVPEKVSEVEDDGSGGLVVRLDGNRSASVRALFTAPRNVMTSPLAEQLGCAFNEGPLGQAIVVDDKQQTSAPGVFAAGDAARLMHNIAFAVSGGAMAGVAAHQSLVFG